MLQIKNKRLTKCHNNDIVDGYLQQLPMCNKLFHISKWSFHQRNKWFLVGDAIFYHTLNVVGYDFSNFSHKCYLCVNSCFPKQILHQYSWKMFLKVLANKSRIDYLHTRSSLKHFLTVLSKAIHNSTFERETVHNNKRRQRDNCPLAKSTVTFSGIQVQIRPERI